MADGWASYGPESSQTGWGEAPERTEATPADVGFTPTDIDYYYTGYEGFPTPEAYGAPFYGKEPVPESYLAWQQEPSHFWGDMAPKLIDNLGPYIGKGLQPTVDISPEFAAFMNEGRAKGKSDPELFKEWYFSESQGKDPRTWTLQDRAVYSFVFGGRDMREQGGPLDMSAGRPSSLYWQIALSHPVQGPGLFLNSQIAMDKGYEVDFYGLARDGRYGFDARPTVNSLLAKQGSEFSGGFQKIGSEEAPWFTAYRDYQGNPLLKPETHYDMTGIWWVGPDGDLRRSSYVTGQGRGSARGMYSLQFPDGTYMDLLRSDLFNKEVVAKEWENSPAGKERNENYKYFGLPVTDAEYVQMTGENAGIQRRKTDERVELLEGYKRGEYSLQDLYMGGLIDKEEWAASAPKHPTENRPMTPAEIEELKAAIATGYKDGVSGVNEPWYTTAAQAAESVIGVAQSALTAIDKGVQIGPVRLKTTDYLLPYPTNVAARMGEAGFNWIVDEIIHPLGAIISSPLWLKDASPDFKEQWQSFLGDRDALVRAIEAGDLTGLPNVRDLELTRNVIENLVTQYERVVPWYGQIGAELPFYMLAPMGGAKQASQKAAVEGVVRARMALNEVTALARSARMTGVADDVSIKQALKVAVDNFDRAKEKLVKAGGKGVFDNEIVNATKETTSKLTVLKALAAEKDALVKAGKAVPQEFTSRFNAAEQGYKEAAQRLNALTQKGMMTEALKLLPEDKGVPTLQNLTDIEKSLLDPEKNYAIGRAVRAIRPLRWAADHLGIAKEARIQDQRVYRLALSQKILYDQARDIAFAVASKFKSQKPVLDVIEKGAQEGMVRNVVPLTDKARMAGTHVQNVLELPRQYGFTDTALAGKYKNVYEHPLMSEMYSTLESYTGVAISKGVPVVMRAMADDAMYFERIAKSIKGVPVKQAERPGLERIWQKERPFEEAKDALTYGIQYENNYLNVFQRAVESRLRSVIDHQLTTELRQLGTIQLPRLAEAELAAAKARLTFLKGKYNALEKYQGKIPAATLKSTAGISDDIARAIQSGASRDQLKAMVLEETQRATAQVGQWDLAAKNAGKLDPIKGVPGLEGYKADPRLARQLTDLLRPKYPNLLVRGLVDLNQVLRFAVTGFDFGVMNIHGLPSLFTNPKAWAQSWGRMFQAFADDKFMYGFAAKHKDALISSIRRGRITYSRPEFMEGAGVLDRIPLAQKVTGRFERSFAGGLDTLKLELWQSLYRPHMTDKQALAVGRFVEQWTSSMSSARLGGSSSAAAIETLLLFAPRYYKSWLSLMGEAATGGITNNLALQAFVRFQTSSHLAYWLTAKALGQEPDMNPASGRYFCLRFGNTDFRFGGFPMAMNKLIANTMIAAHNDPNTTFDFNAVLKEFGRFAQGRASMIARMGVDLALGETYVGQSVVDLKDYMKLSVAQSTLPIWLRAFAQGTPKDVWYDKYSRVFWELVGGVSTPVGAWRTYTETKDRISKQTTGKSWEELWETQKDKARAIEDNPEVRAAKDAWFQEILSKGAGRWGDEKERLELQEKDNKSKDEYSGALALAEKRLNAAGGTLESVKAWREAIGIAGRERGLDLEQQKQDYPAIYEAMGKIDINSIPAHMVAYREYEFAFYNDPRLAEPKGGLEERYDIVNENRTKFIEKWGEEVYQEMRAAHLSGRNLPEKYTLYRTDVDDISRSGYWEFSRNTEADRAYLYSWRAQNPEIDAKLYLWGYVNTIQTDKAATIASNMLADMGMDKRGVPIPVDRVNYQKEYDRLKNETNYTYNLAFKTSNTRSVDYINNKQAVDSLQNRIRGYERELANNPNPDAKERAKANIKTANLALEQIYHLVTNLSFAKPHDVYLRALNLEIQQERYRLKGSGY